MTLPSGTVTFLFTDIEGSTKLAQEHPDEMPALLARHNKILNQVIQIQNGYVFQIIGDAFCAAFHSASDALNAATDAQQALQSEPWNPAPIKVRMGIHTGTVQLNDEEQYSGYATLASTQRIMSAGHGGQILLSSATHELVRDMLPKDSTLLDLGEKQLKDLLRPEHLYQFNISGLATTFPPLKTLDSYPNNLPTHLTSFIGRENEIAEVSQDLSEHRLVTLTGSGGTGKTRLSLQVAADMLDSFPNGVWFVELAPITDPELIPQTILTAIGIKEQEGKTPIDLLKEYLSEKRTLIVLDNCEHLVSASARVVNELLRAAPRIKVLASSREALGVRGEASYPVPSLSLPNPKQLPTMEGLSQYEAVRLFIDRALLANPRFEVDKDNAPYIAQICYRLDGIPLAIELAAARVKILSVEQISKRLDDRFRLLTGGARTALPRQQTLRALIDWSYDILEENEQLLLRRLSVFMGGWSLEAAEDVCTGDEIDSIDVLELLSQLINKSLVVVIDKSKSGETRYRMLETIRQYAREKLLETGGSEAIHQRHLAYFLKLAERAEPELYRSNQALWFFRWDEELDNLRIALEWSLNSDVETGLRILVSLRFFLDSRALQHEMGDWFIQFLERYPNQDILRSQALTLGSHCIVYNGKYDEARVMAEQSLQLSRELHNQAAEAFSLWGLGALMLSHGDLREGAPLVEESLALYREMGDELGITATVAWLSVNDNSVDIAKAYINEGLRLSRELGNLAWVAICLELKSRWVIWDGDFFSPVPWLEEAKLIHLQLGSVIGEGNVLNMYGILEYWRGNYQKSCDYLEGALEIFERVGVHSSVFWVHTNMAYARMRMGDISKAKEMFSFCIEKFKKVNNRIGVIFAIEGMAKLNVIKNQLERASQLFAWTDVARDEIGDHRPPVERASVEKDLQVIQSQLSEQEFKVFSEKGRTMTTEQAIALALEN
ncbi:MAG TPA: tetratricopeptide repeat protein [Anaerolineales bacterium]|nr:tetratricopeptide repeat protein [Anaerolineales bacterium]